MIRFHFVGRCYGKRNSVSKTKLFNILTCFVFVAIITGCSAPLSALTNAARNGDIGTIKKAQADGQNINELDTSGSTALMHAIWKGKTDAAKYLIDSGADIKVKDKNGCDALIYAVDNEQIEIINILLNKGANIESVDDSNSSPLMHAVFYGYYVVTELLLDRGANIESKDSGGATAIINAVRGSKTEKIVPLLINRGADLKVKDKEGYSPLEWALYYKKMDLAAIIKKGMTTARQDTPTSRIVLVRESNSLMPGENQNVIIYIDEQMVANLGKNSTDYIDISPGKHSVVIKGGKLEGDFSESFETVAGQTYYFAVSRRIGSAVAGLGGAFGQLFESQLRDKKAGPFEVTPMEESLGKEKIKAFQTNN